MLVDAQLQDISAAFKQGARERLAIFRLLRDLAAFNDSNKRALLTPRYNLNAMTLEALKGTNEEVVAAISIYVTLSGLDDLKSALLGQSFGLAAELVRLLREPSTSGQARVAALTVIRNICDSKSRVIEFMGVQSDTIQVLMFNTSAPNESHFEAALLTMRGLVIKAPEEVMGKIDVDSMSAYILRVLNKCTPEQKVIVMESIASLVRASSELRASLFPGINALSELLGASTNLDVRKLALRCLVALTKKSKKKTHQHAIEASETLCVRLVESMKMETEAEEVTGLCIAVLSNLCDYEEYSAIICSPTVGVATYFVAILSNASVGDDVVMGILDILVKVTAEDRSKSRKLLGRADISLPSALIFIIKGNKTDKRYKALKIIHNLSSEKANVEYLASAQVDLFIVLMEAVFYHESDRDGNIIEALSSIRNLLVAKDNKDYMKSMQLGLMKLMMEVLTKNARLPTVKAVDILLFLIRAPDSGVYVGASLYLGLIDRFVALILNEITKSAGEADAELALACMKCITEVSCTKEHLEYLISNSALQAMIPLLIRSVAVDVLFLPILDLLDTFVYDSEHCASVASFPGLVDALLDAITRGKCSDRALNIFKKLSKAAGRDMLTSAKDFNIIEVLFGLLNASESDQEVVLKIFESLSSWEANVDVMISDTNELYPKLLSLLTLEDTHESCRESILNILYNFSVLPNGAITMCSRKYNLFEILCQHLKADFQPQDGPFAELRIFRSLSTTTEVIEILGAEDSGYVQAISIILEKPLSPLCLDEIWTTLRQLSAHSMPNQLFIANSPTHELLRKIQLLLSRLSGDILSSSTLSVLKLLRNLTAASKNHPIIAGEENGFLPMLLAAISAEEGDSMVTALAVLRNITVDPIISARLLEEKYNFVWHLKQIVMRDSSSDLVANLLSIFFNLSLVPANAKALGDPEAGIIPSLMKILDSGHRETRFICLRVFHNLCLSTDDKQNDWLMSGQCNLIHMLVQYILEGRDADQVICIQIMIALASSSVSVTTELGKYPVLVKALVDVFSSSKLEPRLIALSLVQMLTTIPENIESIAMPPSILLAKLNVTLRECVAADLNAAHFSNPISEYIDILKIVANVASNHNQMKQLLIASKEISFLKPLLDCLKSDFPIEIQGHVYNIFKMCAISPQNKLLFMSPPVGLMEIFRIHLESACVGNFQIYAPMLKELVGLLVQLSMVANNLELLGGSSKDLISKIVKLLVNYEAFDDALLIDILSFLQNVSTSSSNLVYLGSRQLRLVEALIGVSRKRTFDLEISVQALTVLRNLSGSPENVDLIGEQENGLIAALSAVIKRHAESNLGALVYVSLVLVQNLCWSHKNSCFIGSAASNLMSTILDIAKQASTELSSTAFEIIRNLTSFMDALEYLLSAGLGLVETLLGVYNDAVTTSPHLATVIFGIFCNCADDRVAIDVMMKNEVHRLAIKALAAAPADASAWGSDESLHSNALVFLLNCCKWPEAFRDLNDADIVDRLKGYLQYDCEHGLRSFVALVYLMRGREDKEMFASISSGHFNFSYLVDIVDGFIKDDLRKYADSMPLKVFLRALVCMCMSDFNFNDYMTPRLASVFAAVIERQHKCQFTTNADGAVAISTSGHASEDFELEAAEVAMEGILLSSFRCDSTHESLESLIPESIRDSLRPLLTDYATVPGIRSEVVYKSLYILYYFFGSEGIQFTKSIPIQRHLFISHSALRPEKAGLVSHLYLQLVESGLEVWRDITGSAVAPAESCDSLEAKVARIHASISSAFVILCLSKSYKTDVVSRMELKLAIDSGANVIVLFLESGYTFDSPDECVDGWLDITKSASGSQMMWASSQVRSAVEFIINAIGPDVARHTEVVKCMAREASATVIAPVPLSEEAELLGVSAERLERLSTAWSILQSPSNAVDAAALEAYLDKIGTYSALDLRQCDEDDLKRIGDLLKKIQMKRFLQCF